MACLAMVIQMVGFGADCGLPRQTTSTPLPALAVPRRVYSGKVRLIDLTDGFYKNQEAEK